MRFLPFALAALPSCALAQAASVPASLASSGPGLGQFVQVLLMLGLVLALIVGAAWLMRRFSLLPGGQAGNQLRVVSGVMVGPKERVVIVEQGETWLVVGVTAQSVNLLHTLPRPDDAPVAGAPVPLPPFAEKLAALMKKAKA
ncbi:flagellar biosynthetic protein FliO [Jeongeupia naejangsanensis]|uniref:Flagellar protein n=1 Tax=Jeongeupia naejangsanensis TaxID=613195 RepID=A0ABS2BKT6_9NEIS|nr:flagellar biosynthetic protein FliO [Jeongeupia naejangsanensis]MBM3116203.1 flagellar biosynthetic protein FliO [Jeongeupia naejangsanensis]